MPTELITLALDGRSAVALGQAIQSRYFELERSYGKVGHPRPDEDKAITADRTKIMDDFTQLHALFERFVAAVPQRFRDGFGLHETPKAPQIDTFFLLVMIASIKVETDAADPASAPEMA